MSNSELPKGWRECKLGDVLNFGNGKSRPKIEGEYPIYGGNGILGYSNEFNYTDETIVIGRVGAYCGSVYYEINPIWVSDNALSAKPKKDNCSKFLYYFLRYIDLNSHAGGSSHPLITQSLLNSLDIRICTSFHEQKAIAEVLSSLDDKIDLLHQQNQTLEDMAQTLFREWFIEKADEGWEITTLGSLGKVITGKTPSTKIESYWGDEISFVTPTDFKYYGKFSNYSDRCLSGSGVEKVKKSLIPKNSILVTCIGSDMGKIVISQKECVTNQQINSLIVNNPIMVEYIYEYLKYSYPLLRAIAMGGTTMPIINKTDFENIEIFLPEDHLIKEFHNIAYSFSEKILQNTEQIKTLEQTRDTLLPKLMSGQVRV
ncbi:restriction endonuclease subunit S [Francisella tularensis]|uniref:restriction endonuclease subunit S n=1 Tax=Francisella tularensis TaxID=263 RepID=UPI0008F52F00|nr:restriction endonuclease subunit S [Francisella tularensis]APA82316.1 Type I restriction-modification system, specificity subunit S [Francisella tularensis subsp. novicida PA10-7858]